jgi:hypothetical protein
MFEYEVDGKLYQVSEELLDTFKKKYPNAVEKKKQQEQAGKTQPQVTGAPVEEAAAPEDTASKPEDTSLGSQLIETKPPKKRLFGAPDMEPVYVEQEPLDITYTQATDKLKSALDTSVEETASYFGDKYFDSSKAPIKYTDETYYSGVAGGMVRQVPDKEQTLKSYFGEEKYNQYLEYQKDPSSFFNKLPGELKSKYKDELRQEKSTKFFDSLEERERDVYKKLVTDGINIVTENSKARKDLEYTIDKFEKSINLSTEEAQKEGLVSYKDDIENLLYIQKEIESFTSNIDRRADVLEDAIKQSYISDRPEEAEKLQKFVFSLQAKLDNLVELEAQAFKALEEKGYFEEEKNILKKQKDLLDELKSNKVIYDNFGDIASSISAASYEYDTRLKFISQLKTSLFNSAGNVVSAGAAGLSYLFDAYNEEGASEALKMLSEAASDFANDQIIKHSETYAPTPKVKDIKSLRDLQRWAGHATADQSYNIAVVMAGGAVMNTLAKGGSTAMAIRNVKLATASALGTSSGSAQYSQMDIAQDLSIDKITELNSRIQASNNSIEKSILQSELDTQIYNRDLSQINKAWTAVAYGAAETLGEYFGTLGVLGRLSDFSRYSAGLNLKGQIGKLMAGQLVRGTAVENVEEIATALMQNSISIAGGNPDVNLYDNINTDLFASTTLTSGILQGNSAISTTFSLIGNVAKTEAERKKFLEDGARLLELQGLQEEARRKKKKFQEREQMEALLDKLGRDGSILVSKIGALSEGERTAVFETQAAIESARARFRGLYAANLDKETTESRRKKIEQELKDLEAKKEVLLSNVFSKKYLGKDFEKRIDKVVAENVELDKFLGIFELSHNSSRVTIGDERYVSVNNRDEFNSWLEKSKYNKEQREALLTAYDEGREPGVQADGTVTTGSNAQYIEDLDLVIVYNDNILNSIYQNVKDGNMEAAAITAAAPLEEVVHRQLFKSKNLNRENFIKAANSLFGLLDENKDKFEPKQYDYIQKRVAQYIEHFSNIKEHDTKEFTLAQEMFLTVANLVATKQIDPKSLSTKRTLKSLVDAFINDLNPNLSMYIQTGDANQTLGLVNSLYKKIQDGKLKASAVDDEESKLAKEIKAKAQSLGQKELNDRVDNLVGKKDENGNYQWKSKEEFQASEEFVNVYDKIINGNLIDPLIRRGIEGDVIYGKPVERFVEDVKDGLTGTLMRFDPTANNSLIGWINLQLGRRKGDVSNQYKKEFGEFGTTSIDIEAGEVGSLREIEAEDQAFDEAIDIEEEIVDETKGLIIPGVEVLGKEANQELIDEIKNTYADIQLEGKNYKNLPRLATKYVSEASNVPEAKIVDPKKNLSSSEYANGAKFLSEIADTFIKILPEGAITNEAASEALRGTSTGVPKNVLNFAYNKNDERFANAAGLFVFEKNKDLTKEQLLEAIGLNPDGSVKPGITGRSPESQTVKASLNLLDRIITNTAVRVVGGEMGMSMNTQLDIRSGTVEGVFNLSTTKKPKQAEEEYKTFLKGFEIKTRNSYNEQKAQEIIDNFNKRKIFDVASGKQTVYLENAKEHVRLSLEFISHLPDSVLSNNFSILESVLMMTHRGINTSIVSLDKNGNRYINDLYDNKYNYKKFKKNPESTDYETDLKAVAEALVSKEELKKAHGTKFEKSKILSNKTKDLASLVKSDQSLAPFDVSKINPSNFQTQMEKFDSPEWKNNIQNSFLVIQSAILDFTDYYEKNGTKEEFDSWISFVQRLYSHTAQDNNGFRKLSTVDVENSYAYDYQRIPADRRNKEGKPLSLLYGEHVPTSMSSMVDLMAENLYNRQLSEEMPTIIIVPRVDAKYKDKKLKFGTDVKKILNLFASRRKQQKNQSRIIYYQRPGRLFPSKSISENFADIIGVLEQLAYDREMKNAQSLTTGVKIDIEEISDGYFSGEFKVSDFNYRMNFDISQGEDSWMVYEGKYNALEQKLKIPKGTIDKLRVAHLSFGKENDFKDPESEDNPIIYNITGDAAKGKVNQFVVLGSVINAARKLAEQTNVDAITFTSAEQSRSQLYHRMARFFAKEMGWYTHSMYLDNEGGSFDSSVSHTIYNPEAVLKDSQLTKEERQDWRINGIYSLGTLETKFAGMISMKDARITPGQVLDLSTAKNLAAKRKKRFDVINPAANDFEGLMYVLLAKGKLGEEQYEWMQKNLFEPYGAATYKLNNTRQRVARGLKKIEKENKELFKKLKKDSGFGGFTFEQALRVWLFSKVDKTPSGVDEDTKKALVAIVKNNKDIEELGYKLSGILPMKEFWVDPDPETWQVDSIRTDVINAIEKVARKQFLGEWKDNIEQIFSKNNMNKLTAAFGEEYIDALKDMLYRMETGSSRPEGMNKQMNVFMNWVRGSVATTMFFNRRSAVLQQISNVNFLNWGDNNPIAAAKAFANQKQYWKDFVYILNSDYLKERRGGLKTDINAAELAEAAKKHGYKGVLSKVLQAGFTLTQLGDSLAIATGGSTFYRNRINTYLSQGLTKEDAEKKAFIDFQELSEETQQSARPDRLSQQQTNIIGRTFLSFQNTPMQMTRLAVRAGKDLLAGRGNPKEKVFKMLYYGAIQSIIFSLMQTALIGDMFSVFGDDEGDDEDKLIAKKKKRVINGVVDSFLKGTGMYGVAVATTKNAIIKFIEQEQRKKEGKRPDYAYVLLEVLNVSPPVGIKARNFYGALKNYEYNAKYIGAAGWNLNNPAIDIGSSALDSLLNIPALSIITILRDISAAFDEDLEVMTRLALIAGWHTWDLNLQDKELNKIKAEVKELNKQLRKSKKTVRGSR